MPSTGTGQIGTRLNVSSLQQASSEQTAAYALRFTRTQAGSSVKTNEPETVSFHHGCETSLSMHLLHHLLNNTAKFYPLYNIMKRWEDPSQL